MNKIIVEVGSTVTKVDQYDGEQVSRLEDITIWFKKNYAKENKIANSDYLKLVEKIKTLKEEYEDIYVCGTSIFRSMDEEEKKQFLNKFQKDTGFDFHIISQEDESILTVLGVTKQVKEKVCVMIAGGGSTELAIYDGGLKENVGTSLGVMDIMEKFPDLADDLATTSLEEVKNYVKERLNFPKEKANILILAGGSHEYFARTSGIKYEENTLYQDSVQPIMMDIKTREKETERYFKGISLDEIRSRVDDTNWWYATRAMCAFSLAIAEEIGANYIVPTNVGMVYGLLDSSQ